MHRRIGFWYRLAVIVIKPLSVLLTRRDWRGAHHIPSEGGVIVAVNHLSYVDPLTFGHYVYNTGRLPRYLAKASLFEVPVLKWVFVGAQQIPVRRGTADAAQALSAGVEALQRGECLLIYPEGSATRDPDHWPMRAHTGVARLALLSGAPVIPVAQWGAQELWPYPTKRPHPFPRKTIQITAGPAVDLTDLRSKSADDPEVVREATERVMAAITELLVGLRGGTPPALPYDPRVAA